MNGEEEGVKRTVQQICLLFEVELEIVSWGLQICASEGKTFSLQLGHTQVGNILSVELESAERRHQYFALGVMTILT